MNVKPVLPSYFAKSRAHHLDNKAVNWTTLERANCRHVDFDRVSHKGIVRLVSPCGLIAMVQKDNDMVEVEVCDLDVIR
jgi:hypothetical protein